jgi:hypothetical protein
MPPTPLFLPPILRTRLPAVRRRLARCWVHMERPQYWRCCPGGCGEAGGEGGRSWREWKAGRALQAEVVGLGVWREVAAWRVGVGAAGEG